MRRAAFITLTELLVVAIIPIAFGPLTAPPAFAIGYFEFRNRDPFNGINARVFDAEGVPLAGTNYLAALYVGPSLDALKPAVDEPSTTKLAIVPFHPGNGAGYVVSPGTVWAFNVEGGAFAWMQMVAWDARLGETFEEAQQWGIGGYGQSEPFQIKVAFETVNATLPQPIIGLKSFRLQPLVAVQLREVRRTGDQLLIEWSGKFRRYLLQQTSALDKPWENLGEPTTDTNASIPIGGAGSFFRVVGLLD